MLLCDVIIIIIVPRRTNSIEIIMLFFTTTLLYTRKMRHFRRINGDGHEKKKKKILAHLLPVCVIFISHLSPYHPRPLFHHAWWNNRCKAARKVARKQ